MTIRAQTTPEGEPLTVVQVQELIRARLPRWVTVSAREDTFRRSIRVTLSASAVRLMLSGQPGRTMMVARARCAAASSLPAGVLLEVAWR